MFRRPLRRAVAGATVAGMFIMRHRIISSVAVVFVLAAAVGLGTFGVLARGPSQEFPGTAAPGSHQWYSVAGNIEANYCNACHKEIHDELVASSGFHQGDSCLSCHPAGPGQHVANGAQCVDCHVEEATELDVDAHASFYTELGESAATASWSCKACHTQVNVAMTVTENPPLPLSIGPTWP